MEAPRPTIIKLDNAYTLIDRWRDWLIEAGYQVIRAQTFREGLRLIRRAHPALVLVADDHKSMDAVEWIELQHSDSDPALALIPLLVITDARHSDEMRLQELPDRVRVIERPVTEAMLIEIVKNIIEAWP